MCFTAYVTPSLVFLRQAKMMRFATGKQTESLVSCDKTSMTAQAKSGPFPTPPCYGPSAAWDHSFM